MSRFQEILKGGDLRSIGRANEIVAAVNTAEAFDELLEGLKDTDRKVVMRTADALEKISIKHPEFLQKHKNALLKLSQKAQDIELKWHLAILLSRLTLGPKELKKVWDILTFWAKDQKEGKIVRVHAIQGLYNLMQQHPAFSKEFYAMLAVMEKESIPSLNARIQKLKQARPKSN